MASTVTPLSEDEQLRLLSGLQGLPLDAFEVRLTWVFRNVGIHPKVLADPDRYSLAVDRDHLTWRRAKNLQFIRFRVDPVLRPWIEEFVLELRARARGKFRGHGVNRALYYLRLVKTVGKMIGIENLSPRGLRHTAIWRCMRKTHDVNQARRLFGCTAKVALDYAYTPQDQATDDVIGREGI